MIESFNVCQMHYCSLLVRNNKHVFSENASLQMVSCSKAFGSTIIFRKEESSVTNSKQQAPLECLKKNQGGMKKSAFSPRECTTLLDGNNNKNR